MNMQEELRYSRYYKWEGIKSPSTEITLHATKMVDGHDLEFIQIFKMLNIKN